MMDDLLSLLERRWRFGGSGERRSLDRAQSEGDEEGEDTENSGGEEGEVVAAGEVEDMAGDKGSESGTEGEAKSAAAEEESEGFDAKEPGDHRRLGTGHTALSQTEEHGKGEKGPGHVNGRQPEEEQGKYKKA